MGFCFEFSDEFDDIGVVALTKNATLSLDNFSFRCGKFEILDDFDGNFFFCFFIFAPKYVREITSAYSL